MNQRTTGGRGRQRRGSACGTQAANRAKEEQSTVTPGGGSAPWIPEMFGPCSGPEATGWPTATAATSAKMTRSAIIVRSITRYCDWKEVQTGTSVRAARTCDTPQLAASSRCGRGVSEALSTTQRTCHAQSATSKQLQPQELREELRQRVGRHEDKRVASQRWDTSKQRRAGAHAPGVLEGAR